MGLPEIMKPDSGLFDDAGDRWMRSIEVELSDGERSLKVDAYRFEVLLLALRIRHLGVHPRSREIVPGSIPGARLNDMIERNWSSLDSWDVEDLGRDIQALCSGDAVSWRRA